MQFLPLFFKLDQKPVLICGGGEKAVRKAELLLKAGAHRRGRFKEHVRDLAQQYAAALRGLLPCQLGQLGDV